MTDDVPEWRCFHCDEVFTDRDAAAEHFGVQIPGDVACKLNATEGLLVKMLREAQKELRRYRREDNESYRTFYALGAEHETKMRRVEEEGYVRGLKDYQKLNAATSVALAALEAVDEIFNDAREENRVTIAIAALRNADVQPWRAEGLEDANFDRIKGVRK